MHFQFLYHLCGSEYLTGSVVDHQGVPLPGATVLEIGTSNGTTTDFDGNYSVTVQDGASISASFVGYDTQL